LIKGFEVISLYPNGRFSFFQRVNFEIVLFYTCQVNLELLEISVCIGKLQVSRLNKNVDSPSEEFSGNV